MNARLSPSAPANAPPPVAPPPQEFPSLITPLLTERDQYMAFMLRRLASRAHTVVAIVGAGHLQGIRHGGGRLPLPCACCYCRCRVRSPAAAAAASPAPPPPVPRPTDRPALLLRPLPACPQGAVGPAD